MGLRSDPDPQHLTCWSEPRVAYDSPTLGSSAYLHYFYDQRHGPRPETTARPGAADDRDPSTAVRQALDALIKATF